MKYIVLDAPGGAAAVLFPRSFMHRWVAALFAPMPVLSAGFVRTGTDGLECYGRSSGLGLAARPEADTALVADALAESDPAHIL
ncbi:MAG: hypothetical protein JNM48_13155 [Rhodospirillales bacterium]|nr:hypothetical protein [Rhodospirillales bacterium]